jgi:hypothetical protein
MKMGSRIFDSPYGKGDSPLPYGDVTIPVSIWELPYGNEEPNLLFPIWKLCSPFPYGDPQIHVVIPFMEMSYTLKGTSDLLSTMLTPNTTNTHSRDP